ncbi:hypothetical protein [Planobispora rosea]|uniref:hypothetical protein n=1 Tax=Planobispora rosea TaxID=35762 RepID=UPI0009FD1A84|nr:hypothetical protein [Planobispora rosea]
MAAIGAVRIPDEVRAVVQAEPGEPAPAQLWRARWQQVVELLLIVEVDDAAVAMPIMLDDRHADAQTLVLAPGQTSLAVTLTVWIDLVRRLPLYVLDRHVGMVTVDVSRANWETAAIAAGARYGSDPVSRADRRHEIRAGLDDAMDVFATATWTPAGTGELARLLASAAIGVQQLADTLDITPQRALALRRGQVPASDREAAVLAPILGLSHQAVLEANPPPPAGLAAQMSRPRRRAQVVRLARRRGITEHSAWLAATYAVNAQAARQTGQSREPAWEERIDRYFQVALGD